MQLCLWRPTSGGASGEILVYVYDPAADIFSPGYDCESRRFPRQLFDWLNRCGHARFPVWIENVGSLGKSCQFSISINKMQSSQVRARGCRWLARTGQTPNFETLAISKTARYDEIAGR